MNKRVVCLLGSPRRGGNSDLLATRFCDRVRESGAEVEGYALADLNYSGCKNLFRCKTDLEHCGQNDDLTPVLAAIARADVLVLVSPIFFTDMTGQMKSAIDRFFSFFVPDYPTATQKSRLGRDRTLVLIQTQGEGEDCYGDLLERYSHGFQYLGFDQQHLIRAWGVREPAEVGQHEAFLTRCDAVADAVLAGG